MPHTCFSYETDGPADTRKRDVVRAAPRDPCGIGYPCFSYPQMCFGYRDDIRVGTGSRGAVQPDLRRMPFTCFRY